jgi:thiol-disulfide isomerase/thioredoxin
MRLAACLLALAFALPALAESEVQVGAPAPPFALRVLNPEAAGTGWIALDRWAGAEPEDADARVVLVSFFASWCEPCKKEMPLLVQLDAQYRARGLRILAVDIDGEEEGIAAARALVEKAGVRYPVGTDRFNFLARRYLGDQAPLPSVFLVRRDGTVLRVERGYTKNAARFLRAAVEAELAPAPAGASRAKAKTAAVTSAR